MDDKIAILFYRTMLFVECGLTALAAGVAWQCFSDGWPLGGIINTTMALWILPRVEDWYYHWKAMTKDANHE